VISFHLALGRSAEGGALRVRYVDAPQSIAGLKEMKWHYRERIKSPFRAY